jgi:hypothetical protein
MVTSDGKPTKFGSAAFELNSSAPRTVSRAGKSAKPSAGLDLKTMSAVPGEALGVPVATSAAALVLSRLALLCIQKSSPMLVSASAEKLAMLCVGSAGTRQG